MKRTLQAITLAAALMLVTCATPAMADGPGPPPGGGIMTHGGTISFGLLVSLLHLL